MKQKKFIILALVLWSVLIPELFSFPPFSKMKNARAEEASEEPHHEAEGRSGGPGGPGKNQGHKVVRLDPEQLQTVELGTAVVMRGSLTAIIKLPAEVQWNADRLLHITPRVDGVVLSVEKSLGDRVREGDLLATLDSPEIGRARMDFLGDLNRLDLAELVFNRARMVYENTIKLLKILYTNPAPEEALARAGRLPSGENKNRLLTKYTIMRVNERSFHREKRLYERKVSSEVDYLVAKGAFETARADYLSTREEISFNLEPGFLKAKNAFKIAENNLRNSERSLHILGLTAGEIDKLRKSGEKFDRDISRTGLYSSVSGVIINRHASRGERVGMASTLFKIADTSRMWVMASVYERDLRFLRKGQRALVRLDAFPGDIMEGTLDYIGSELNPDTRTTQARVVLPNKNGRIRAGMFGSVTLLTGPGREGRMRVGLLVPTTALQRTASGFSVFRERGKGEYEEIPVKAPRKSADFAIVIGDLKEGDRLATGDLFILKSEAGRESMGDND